VPTNNATERVIELTYKIRAKTLRGFESWDKALSHPYLSVYLQGDDGMCDLRKVVKGGTDLRDTFKKFSHNLWDSNHKGLYLTNILSCVIVSTSC